MIKAVILDLDGVYFQNGTENFISTLMKKFKLTDEMIKDVYLRSDMMKKYKLGLVSGEEFWNYAIKTWNIKSNKDGLLKILLEGYELNGKKKEIMLRLHNHDIKRIVCSNNFRERIEMLNNRFYFLQEFDHVILSYENNLLKPHLLDLVSKKTGIPNSDITYFDDNKENIDYARSIGMNGILIAEPTRVLKMLKEMLD